MPSPLDSDISGRSRAEVMDSTAVLLDRARAGDVSARDTLLERYLPALRRIAHGRLPRRARGLSDTGDLVQATVLRALRRLGDFRPEREGAFLSYLRAILLNQIRDEARRVARRPQHEPLSDDQPESGPGLLEEIIGREYLEHYEAALQSLPADHREAVILRLECGHTYDEIAVAIGKRSSNATRMLVGRAVRRIANSLKKLHSASGHVRSPRNRARSRKK